MLATEANELTSVLFAAFPQTGLREGTISFYERAIRSLDYSTAREVIEELCLDARHLPYIAEIRRAVLEREHPIPTALEAWAAVSQANPEGEKRELHPLAKRVRDLFGGSWSIKNTENPSITRAQFLKAYDEFRDGELRRTNVAQFRETA